MFLFISIVCSLLVVESRGIADITASTVQQQEIASCTDRDELTDRCEGDEDLPFEVSLLQTHFSITGSASNAPVKQPSVAAKERFTDGLTADEKVQAQRIAELLSAGYDDAQHMEQRHWNLLMVICVSALTVTVALSHKASNHRKRFQEFDLQHLKNKIDFRLPLKAMPPTVDLKEGFTGTGASKDGPVFRPLLAMGPTVALKEPVEYTSNPEECLHDGGLRSYTARKQGFRICDQCGCRWILQKDTSTYTPIAPRAAPADPDLADPLSFAEISCQGA